jgi:CheY-like chemotaxis protein
VAPATPSILITDDDLDFRETLQSMFEPQGFRTWLAGDGEEALDIVRSQEVHLVLLDMHMPKLTGLETIRRVKDFRALLPCILLTADADEALVRQALTARADSVLQKPVTRQRITTVVQQALEQAYHWSGFPFPGGNPLAS